MKAADCGCRRCTSERGDFSTVMGVKIPGNFTRMILCAKCGNKRCPHANDHRNECTNSNATGQKGSAYE